MSLPGREMNFDLVIFDCDGVLVDSEPVANRILMHVLAQVGLPMSYEETIQTFVGRSAATCLRMIEERIGKPLPERFASDWDEQLFAAFRSEVRAVEGIEEALGRIAVPVCVASSGSHERMRLTLGVCGLLGWFEGRLFSATEVSRGKPYPDLFLYAARKMGTPPGRCAVVEDTPVGATAAVEAGMKVFGYAGGEYSSATELARSGAAVFHDMAELAALLGNAATNGRRGED